MDEYELPARVRFRYWMAKNWPVVLATALLTVVMVVAVSTLF